MCLKKKKKTADTIRIVRKTFKTQQCGVLLHANRGRESILPFLEPISNSLATVVTLMCQDFNSKLALSSFVPIGTAIQAFLVHFTSDTVRQPTQIYRETRQRQCSKPISSVISLLWARHTKGNIRRYHEPACTSPSHHHEPIDIHKSANGTASVCVLERERARE